MCLLRENGVWLIVNECISIITHNATTVSFSSNQTQSLIHGTLGSSILLCQHTKHFLFFLLRFIQCFVLFFIFIHYIARHFRRSRCWHRRVLSVTLESFAHMTAHTQCTLDFSVRQCLTIHRRRRRTGNRSSRRHPGMCLRSKR